MEDGRSAPKDAKDFRIPPTSEEFGNYLRAMVDPQTPEEWQQFRAGQERVRENTEALLEKLPKGPSGEAGGLRMSEVAHVELIPGQEVSPGSDMSEGYVRKDLLAFVDPQTPDEKAAVRASHERVRETEERLRRDLRSSRPPRPWRATW